MKIESVFRPLAEMERALSDLYNTLSETFASDPELAFVFFKMSAEEKGHASLVDYQRRMVQKNQGLSAEVECDLTVIQETLERAKALSDSAAALSPEAAIRATLELETSAAECHYRNALKQSNPEIARLLGSLGSEDRLHISRMRDVAAKRGVKV